MKLISMHESDDDTRKVAAGGLLTGTSDAPELPSLADLEPGPNSTIHRRNRFALIPCASAVLATDTPGRRHICTSARLATALYVRRPPGGARTTSPSTISTLFSVMVSTNKTSGHYPSSF
jgi:hypothetical protein